MAERPPSITALMAAHNLPHGFDQVVDEVYRPLATWIAQVRRELDRPTVIGVCGGQGSGKSTLAAFVGALLERDGCRTATLSLDDLHLPKAARAALARDVHPLLATRGVPGTHDVAMGLEVLDGLRRAGRLAIPRFDKAADDRAPTSSWPVVSGPVDVVLFEGWCVGATPQPIEALAQPINALERDRDANGGWRRYVNERLAGDYQHLFALMDRLILLQAASFDHVFAWRALQERKLGERLRVEARLDGQVMDGRDLAAFVMHYERLTRHMLDEAPGRADAILRLGPDQEVLELRFKPQAGRSSAASDPA